MNNSIDATSAAAEAYSNYIQVSAQLSGLALLGYTSMVVIDQEMEYIWSKRLSLPNLLYIVTRYGSLVFQGLTVWLLFLPAGSLCNAVANIYNAVSILLYISIQGLLATRAYSLCQGNRFIFVALLLSFLGGLIILISESVLFPGCFSSFPTLYKDITFAGNISVTLTDVLVFAVSLRSVWGTWKLKREAGIGGSTNDLVSKLMKQIVTRFCFVCVITFACTVVTDWFVDSPVITIFATLQQALSAILTADGLLDLRHRNSTAIESRNVSLPNTQSRNILQHIHESIIVEMGDHMDVYVEDEEGANGAAQLESESGAA